MQFAVQIQVGVVSVLFRALHSVFFMTELDRQAYVNDQKIVVSVISVQIFFQGYDQFYS